MSESLASARVRGALPRLDTNLAYVRELADMRSEPFINAERSGVFMATIMLLRRVDRQLRSGSVAGVEIDIEDGDDVFTGGSLFRLGATDAITADPMRRRRMQLMWGVRTREPGLAKRSVAALPHDSAALEQLWTELDGVTQRRLEAFAADVEHADHEEVAVAATLDYYNRTQPAAYLCVGATRDLAHFPSSLVYHVLATGWRTRPCVVPAPAVERTFDTPLMVVYDEVYQQAIDRERDAIEPALLQLAHLLPLGWMYEHQETLLIAAIAARRAALVRQLLSPNHPSQRHVQRALRRPSLLTGRYPLGEAVHTLDADTVSAVLDARAPLSHGAQGPPPLRALDVLLGAQCELYDDASPTQAHIMLLLLGRATSVSIERATLWLRHVSDAAVVGKIGQLMS